MLITIIGAGSLTAGALVPMLLEETEYDLHLISSKDIENSDPRIRTSKIDLLDKTLLKTTVMQRIPQVIINTAAYTNVDECETERSIAWQLNVALVETLARLARVTDSHLIHFSTDYVFDGTKGPYTEADLPSPINYYGKTKLAGENACLSSGCEATVVRTNVVYGPGTARMDFVRWLLVNIESETEMKIVTDQFSNPTYVDDLAEAVTRIVLRKRTGLYNVGGGEYLSRYEFAQRVAAFFKLDESLIVPITTAELHQPAKRPLRGGLVSIKAESDLRMKMRGIESGLISLRHALFAGAKK